MMNGLDKLIEAGNAIESRLITIRENINAPLGVFPVPLKDIIIKEIPEETLAKGKEGTPIGEFYLAYLKDNSHRSKDDHDRCVNKNNSNCFTDGKKLHFYHCKGIRSVEKRITDKKYVCTSHCANIQPIDLRDKENIESHLPLCQYCIGILIENGDVDIDYSKKPTIAEYGDAKELMDCVKRLHNKNIDAKKKTKEFITRTLIKRKVI